MASCAFAQNPPTQQAQEPPIAERPADQYFSGTVVSYAGEKVTVARTVLGKNSVPRDFLISPDTQIEGRLRVKVRVTVQYVAKDDVDYAIHIIVRNPAPKK
jgi:hypothetical protein